MAKVICAGPHFAPGRWGLAKVFSDWGKHQLNMYSNWYGVPHCIIISGICQAFGKSAEHGDYLWRQRTDLSHLQSGRRAHSHEEEN